ncbi:unnamed protein product [Owenia fusiformis]|uniref:Uncharacterized protein n=1 Tax=Owenia fusiformis TaxID=6347 RepID=A0A8J1U0H4_OWEFU|nr:unnamed protein product [Owenia fusiformis]
MDFFGSNWGRMASKNSSQLHHSYTSPSLSSTRTIELRSQRQKQKRTRAISLVSSSPNLQSIDEIEELSIQPRRRNRKTRKKRTRNDIMAFNCKFQVLIYFGLGSAILCFLTEAVAMGTPWWIVGISNKDFVYNVGLWQICFDNYTNGTGECVIVGDNEAEIEGYLQDWFVLFQKLILGSLFISVFNVGVSLASLIKVNAYTCNFAFFITNLIQFLSFAIAFLYVAFNAADGVFVIDFGYSSIPSELSYCFYICGLGTILAFMATVFFLCAACRSPGLQTYRMLVEQQEYESFEAKIRQSQADLLGESSDTPIGGNTNASYQF